MNRQQDCYKILDIAMEMNLINMNQYYALSCIVSSEGFLLVSKKMYDILKPAINKFN